MVEAVVIWLALIFLGAIGASQWRAAGRVIDTMQIPPRRADARGDADRESASASASAQSCAAPWRARTISGGDDR